MKHNLSIHFFTFYFPILLNVCVSVDNINNTSTQYKQYHKNLNSKPGEIVSAILHIISAAKENKELVN